MVGRTGPAEEVRVRGQFAARLALTLADHLLRREAGVTVCKRNRPQWQRLVGRTLSSESQKRGEIGRLGIGIYELQSVRNF